MRRAKVEPFPRVQKDLHLIALVGKRLSGKSTVATQILRQDPTFRRVSFGDVLKREYQKLHDLPDYSSWTPDFKETHRKGLISLSWERKAVDPYYFAKKLFSTLVDGESVVIDDMRFIEELHMAVQRGAYVYKIHSERHDRVKRGWKFTPGVDDETSECELDISGYSLRLAAGGRGGTIFNTRDNEPEYISRQVRDTLSVFLREESHCA